MGDTYQIVVDRDASETEAPGLASAIQQWLISEEVIVAESSNCGLGTEGFRPGAKYQIAVETNDADVLLRKLKTNGFHTVVGRTVFSPSPGDFELVCSQCHHRFERTDAWDTAVDQWHRGNGLGILSCPRCGIEEPISEWKHDPPWGFAQLGLQFWNWPKLSEAFVREVTRRLGHRTILVSGKL